MKTSQFSEEKIIYFLKQAEAGVAVKDICRQAGVQENTRLKKLVADLTLDKHILQEVIEKSFEGLRQETGC